MSRYLSTLFAFVAVSAMAKNVDFKLEAVPLPKAISMIYDEVLEKPYMLDPKLAGDTRLISFHTTEKQNFNQFIERYFDNMNIKVYEKNNVVYIAHVEPKPTKLAQFIQGDGQVSASGDKLVFYGTNEEIARVKSVLKNNLWGVLQILSKVVAVLDLFNIIYIMCIIFT